MCDKDQVATQLIFKSVDDQVAIQLEDPFLMDPLISFELHLTGTVVEFRDIGIEPGFYHVYLANAEGDQLSFLMDYPLIQIPQITNPKYNLDIAVVVNGARESSAYLERV